MKKYGIVFSMLFLATTVFSQEHEVEMADVMMENGRIYVVVGVLLIILIGLFLYLINIDRKVGKLEKDLQKDK